MNQPERFLFRWLPVALLFLPAMLSIAQDDKAAGKAGQAGIYGRVYTNDTATGGLKPVGGAQIEISNQAGNVVGQATTDDRGYYAITVPAGSYFYKVSAPGFKDEYAGRGFSLQLTEGDAVMNFTLQQGMNDPQAKPPEITKVLVGQLRGQIYEKTKEGELKGVNGAKVAMRKVGSATGTPPVTVLAKAPTEGESSSGYLRELEAGKWQISVQAEGFVPFVHPEAVEVLADRMAIQDLVLTRPPEPDPKSQGLEGLITLASPTAPPPAIRATLTRLPDVQSPTAVTNPLVLDAAGKFKIDLQPGRYIVRAEADGYLQGNTPLTDVLVGKYSSIRLTLEPQPAEVLVKVFSEETKKPLDAATVKVRLPEEAITNAVLLRTNVTGESKFTAPRAGPRQVLASHPGYKAAGRTVTLKPGSANPVVELYLTPDVQPAVLVLRVLDSATRQPIANAQAKLTLAPGSELQGTTNATGAATINVPKQGQFSIAVSKETYTAVQGTVELFAGNNERTVFLKKNVPDEATLLVRVFCAKQQEPLSGVALRITPAGKGTVIGAVSPTNANGISIIKLSEAGSYRVQAATEGYQAGTVNVVVKAGNNPQRIDLVPLPEPAPATGRLLLDVVQADTRGPVPGARVLLTPIGMEGAGRFDGLTDARGKATSPALAAKTYALSVEKDGFDAARSTMVLAAGDNPKTITLTKKATPPVPVPVPVTQTAKLNLQVLTAETMAPLASAIIRITQGAKVDIKGTSDANGNFVANLPSTGRYTVSVGKVNFEVNQSQVDVSTREVTRKVFLKAIAPAKRTMNVLVREGGLKATKPLAGADVKVLNAKGEVVRTGKTDQLGRFRASDLDVGVYTIEAALTGFVQRAPKPTSDITKGDDQPEVPLFRTGSAPVPPPPPVIPKAPSARVPEVRGKTVAQARQLIEESKLQFTPVDASPTGIAANQLPAAGTEVALGSSVRVTFVAPKPPTPPTPPTPKVEEVVVPSVQGQSAQQAIATLRAARLGFSSNPALERVGNGKATTQSPAAGAKVAVGTTVAVTFSVETPPPLKPVLVAVPNLQGRTVLQAKALLDGVKLQLRPTETSMGDGVATAQNPVAGTQVAQGTAVSVTFAVQKPVPPKDVDVTVPNLQGMTPSQVQETLQAARLGVRNAGPANVSPQAKVVSQSPTAGTKVKANTVVAVQFGEGKVEPKKELPKLVAVPDLRGKQVVEARRALTTLGLGAEFRDSQMNKVFNNADLNGLVKDQKQRPGDQVPAGTTINMTFEFFR